MLISSFAYSYIFISIIVFIRKISIKKHKKEEKKCIGLFIDITRFMITTIKGFH